MKLLILKDGPSETGQMDWLIKCLPCLFTSTIGCKKTLAVVSEECLDFQYWGSKGRECPWVYWPASLAIGTQRSTYLYAHTIEFNVTNLQQQMLDSRQLGT